MIKTNNVNTTLFTNFNYKTKLVQITQRNNTKSFDVKKLNIDDKLIKLITDKAEIATALNRYFCDIGPSLAKNIPPVDCTPENFLKDVCVSQNLNLNIVTDLDVIKIAKMSIKKTKVT